MREIRPPLVELQWKLEEPASLLLEALTHGERSIEKATFLDITITLEVSPVEDSQRGQQPRAGPGKLELIMD